MQGVAVGRAVDLTRFEGYEDLLSKLGEMFDIGGELYGPTKKWQVVYTDDEDDMMMVGDDPWQLSEITSFKFFFFVLFFFMIIFSPVYSLFASYFFSFTKVA